MTLHYQVADTIRARYLNVDTLHVDSLTGIANSAKLRYQERTIDITDDVTAPNVSIMVIWGNT